MAQPRMTLNDGVSIEKARSVMMETKEACMVTNSIVASVELVPELLRQDVPLAS
jgi:hypothetical protein